MGVPRACNFRYRSKVVLRFSYIVNTCKRLPKRLCPELGISHIPSALALLRGPLVGSNSKSLSEEAPWHKWHSFIRKVISTMCVSQYIALRSRTIIQYPRSPSSRFLWRSLFSFDCLIDRIGLYREYEKICRSRWCTCAFSAFSASFFLSLISFFSRAFSDANRARWKRLDR